jgi:LysR family glycine cleavage system transcriptional activator
MLFDQFATVAQAAISGLGLALLPEFLIQDELARGSLIRALDLPMQSTEQYYLAWPASRSAYPPLMAFRQWIVQEAQGNHTIVGQTVKQPA